MAIPPAGQCESCRFARAQRSARGSDFLRCGRSDDDPTYLRYPPLPVTNCAGYESGTPEGSSPTEQRIGWNPAEEARR
jgi:hypothetical protein